MKRIRIPNNTLKKAAGASDARDGRPRDVAARMPIRAPHAPERASSPDPETPRSTPRRTPGEPAEARIALRE